jgi:transposase
VSQAGLDVTKLVFIDETWAKTNMTRLRGRAPIGQRLVAKVPHGHWKTTTLIAALDHRGMRCATTVDGAINQDIFESFVEKVLVPRLKPGDLVILDNLSSHKGIRVKELIQAAGADVVYLPPYSPNFNPIENAFAKLKQLIRSAEHRSREALWADMQRMLDQITPDDVRGFFKHSGYAIQEK